MWSVTLENLSDNIILSDKMKKDNDNAKEKHAKSNSKHQKAVALRTQWLKDNTDKKKEDWYYAIHLKAMNEKFTLKFKEEKTRFLT